MTAISRIEEIQNNPTSAIDTHFLIAICLVFEWLDDILSQTQALESLPRHSEQKVTISINVSLDSQLNDNWLCR